MEKFNGQIDATKINKDKMIGGKYVKFVGIPLKEKEPVTRADKTVVEGDTWRLMKVGFIKQEGNKGDEDMPILGEITKFESKTADEPAEKTVEYPTDDINPDDIPF